MRFLHEGTTISKTIKRDKTFQWFPNDWPRIIGKSLEFLSSSCLDYFSTGILQRNSSPSSISSFLQNHFHFLLHLQVCQCENSFISIKKNRHHHHHRIHRMQLESKIYFSPTTKTTPTTMNDPVREQEMARRDLGMARSLQLCRSNRPLARFLRPLWIAWLLNTTK